MFSCPVFTYNSFLVLINNIESIIIAQQDYFLMSCFFSYNSYLLLIK
jgi:hypothetical protein